MEKWKALAINFIAGISVILGGMIATAMDVENPTLGILLAIGGGTYLYLGFSETIPKALELPAGKPVEEIRSHYAIVFGCFLFGAIIIALILFGHEHCSEGGDEEGGGGHHHRTRF